MSISLSASSTSFDPILENENIRYSVPPIGVSGNSSIDPTRKRRFSVSAESNIGDAEEYIKKYNPKTRSAIDRIRASVSELFLWKGLDEEQQNEIIDAMFEKKVQPGQQIITQGHHGDYFYVIESGIYQVWKKDSVQSAPKKVFEYNGKGSFGELALMYNSRRAATVRAATNGILWAVDRKTFRHICVVGSSSAERRRSRYDKFLRGVPLLNTLTDTIREQLADCLETFQYERGDYVFRQGDFGDSFYLIQSGVALVTQEQEQQERLICSLKETDYFGERSLILNQKRSANIRAFSNTLKVCVIDHATFVRLLGHLFPVMKDKMRYYVNADIRSKVVTGTGNDLTILDDDGDDHDDHTQI